MNTVVRETDPGTAAKVTARRITGCDNSSVKSDNLHWKVDKQETEWTNKKFHRSLFAELRYSFGDILYLA
jgi:hypothetical protein